MNDRQPVDGEVAGAALHVQPLTAEDQEWLAERLRQLPDGRIRLRLEDEQDVSGHAFEDATLVRVVIDVEDEDTVGHAMSIRLPSAEEANAFRRRMLLTGVLVGTVVLGSAGATVAVSHSGDSSASTQAASQVEISDDVIPLPGPAPTPAE